MVEIRSTFHAELEGIRSDVVRLAAMVTERIGLGTLVSSPNFRQTNSPARK